MKYNAHKTPKDKKKRNKIRNESKKKLVVSLIVYIFA